MVANLLLQLAVFIFVGLNISILSWLFPIQRDRRRKPKSKKV